MAQSLKDKVVVITGASSGIGEAAAEALSQKGAKIALLARRKQRLEKLSERLSKNGTEVLVLQVDVSKEDQVAQATQQILAKWGRIDVLIANAGVMLLSPIHGAKTEEWRRMMEINVLGLMYSVHQVLPLMIKQKSGHIVTISSVAGRAIFPNGGAYSASKFAVCAFSESLRREVARDSIRVTVIEPGAVKTELTEHTTHEDSKEFINQFLKSVRALESEDIAAAIVYALEQPNHVDVNEILIRPTDQEA